MIIGSAFSEPIAINKPDLVLSAAQRISGNWMPGQQGEAAFTYANNGTLSAPAGTYQAEFFCDPVAAPFFTAILSKAVAPGASQTDTVNLTFPASGCSNQSAITIKVRPLTAGNTTQCLCAERSAVFSTPLPVSLQTFVAKAEQCTALLAWTTGTEVNAGRFDIQYSTDGRLFETIGNVSYQYPGTGGDYAYTYVLSGEHNFFRLSMVDRDGTAILSRTVAVPAHCAAEIGISPNPTSDDIHINGLQAGDRLYLYGIEGKLLVSFKAKRKRETLPMHTLTQGFYLLKVFNSTGQVKATFKVNKL
ncbi:T9SS type A sorting domain-containing protein [Taibaiella koreensis]|uniref:T9SS type A sorting domain-containing protein n=1 Tax=Taibaiella koreensis TaxID=1268548 RepID=UPI0013C2F2D9|nr:T9SS type A sorting domain-containing protein [Taibaiella koreensis]